jgi:phosphatidylserine/phosphatidylglycerophosphate/cardiolipin synthase-like enzyme
VSSPVFSMPHAFSAPQARASAAQTSAALLSFPLPFPLPVLAPQSPPVSPEDTFKLTPAAQLTGLRGTLPSDTLLLPQPVSSPTPSPTPPAAEPEIQAFFTQVHTGKLEDVQNNAANPDFQLVKLIDSAQTSLDISAFEIDSERVADAILHAAQTRNVGVRIVTDSDYLHEAQIQRLIKAGIPVVDDQRNGLMHNKFVVVDAASERATVWTGSTNLTENCFWKNNNNAIQIRSRELAENFTAEFEEMFVQKKFGISSPSVVPHPSVTVGKTTIQTHFAAEGKVAGKVAEALNKAEKSIHFMAFSFTHDAIGQVVAQKFSDKVEVRGVFENVGAGTQYSEYGKLKALGADVKKDGNPAILHHKVFIIDGKTVITGSFNFSDSADKNNDENLLIIESEELARQYEDEFKLVYSKGR